ncbi:glycosyltransferase family A protein [uncultured Flavobacterium sp.]|uniref:glycosyltransferase family 2 protein n=1 Tax=uncultured Flavobacterium sp. TaxID=165435 RepID=UPI0030C7E8B2
MVAIIIPYFKITFFEKTLESLALQTDKRFKVYIGDDCSPENPTKILEIYKDKLDCTYHRFHDNLGGINLVDQWKRCIELSQNEEWLMLLGDDDFLDTNAIEEFYNYIIKNKTIEIDLVRFKLKIINHLGSVEENNFEYNSIENSERLLQRMLAKEETITASEFIFSRTVYEANGGFINYPLAWFSDYATWLQFGLKSNIHNIENAAVYWRLSGINISSQFKSVKQIRLKLKSLFLFIHYLDTNFKVNKAIKEKYILEHMNYLFFEIKFVDIIKLVVPESIKFGCKFGPIITKFMLQRTQKLILKKISA